MNKNKNVNSGLNDNSYNVQLASYKSKNMADKGWVKFSKQYESILKNFKPIVVAVEIPEKGKYFRLQVGPIDSKNKANDLCQLFKETVGLEHFTTYLI